MKVWPDRCRWRHNLMQTDEKKLKHPLDFYCMYTKHCLQPYEKLFYGRMTQFPGDHTQISHLRISPARCLWTFPACYVTFAPQEKSTWLHRGTESSLITLCPVGKQWKLRKLSRFFFFFSFFFTMRVIQLVLGCLSSLQGWGKKHGCSPRFEQANNKRLLCAQTWDETLMFPMYPTTAWLVWRDLVLININRCLIILWTVLLTPFTEQCLHNTLLWSQLLSVSVRQQNYKPD